MKLILKSAGGAYCLEFLFGLFAGFPSFWPSAAPGLMRIRQGRTGSCPVAPWLTGLSRCGSWPLSHRPPPPWPTGLRRPGAQANSWTGSGPVSHRPVPPWLTGLSRNCPLAPGRTGSCPLPIKPALPWPTGLCRAVPFFHPTGSLPPGLTISLNFLENQ